MVNGKLPKALSKNPPAIRDISTGIMNVPTSIRDLPASGINMRFGDGFKEGVKGIKRVGSKRTTFRKLGSKEGQRLTGIGKKSALRRI